MSIKKLICLGSRARRNVDVSGSASLKVLVPSRLSYEKDVARTCFRLVITIRKIFFICRQSFVNVNLYLHFLGMISSVST